jgi:alkyldihydroxyacetonephosphate synthase
MRRWNGWGDTTIEYPLHEPAMAFLVERLGEVQPAPSASLGEVVTAVSPSRLPPHPLITTDPETRVRHGRGQSFPDWVALRSGQLPTLPDGVAFPTSEDDLRDLLQFAAQHQLNVIPYGGGTSVVGHLNVPQDAPPTLTISLQRLNQLRRWDAKASSPPLAQGSRGPI